MMYHMHPIGYIANRLDAAKYPALSQSRLARVLTIHATRTAPLQRLCNTHAAMSERTAETRSPYAISAIAFIGTAAPTCPGANAVEGRYRSAWTRKRGTRAACAGSLSNAGVMYHFATSAKRTSENVNCRPNNAIGLMGYLRRV